MNKILALLCVGTTTLAVHAGNYTTAGNGTTHTLSSLAAINGSGVIKAGNVIKITDSLTIAKGDKFQVEDGLEVQLGNKVVFRINGQALFEAANGTKFTAIEGATPFSITVGDPNNVTKLKNITFDQVGFRGAGMSFEIDKCTFINFNGANRSHGAFTMNSNGSHYKFTNCTFKNNQYSAIIGAANYNTPVVIENCTFLNNGTNNSLYPQLNITVADTVIIRNNIITGDPAYMRVGGIAVSNLLGSAGKFYTLIEGNKVTDNSYGMTLAGPQMCVIKNNVFANNSHIANAMMGGSGISISNTGGNNTIMIEGNIIENNLWGITLIGGKQHVNVNMGKVTDPTADDYNPGKNILANNRNNGVFYDLYNNSSDKVYAQGNKWNVAVQDSASIETVVTHYADNQKLGLVIFMPAFNELTGVDNVKSNTQAMTVETRYYNLTGASSSQPFDGVNIVVTRYSDGTITNKKILQ